MMASASAVGSRSVSYTNRYHITGAIQWPKGVECSHHRIQVIAKDLLGRRSVVGSFTCPKGETSKFGLCFNWNNGWFSCRKISLEFQLEHDSFPLGAKLKALRETRTLGSQEVNFDGRERSHHGIAINFAQTKLVSEIEAFPVPKLLHLPGLSYFKELLRAVLPEAVKNGLVAVGNKLFTLSLDQVQGFYDLFGKVYPKYPLTVETLLDQLLNRICSVPYTVEGRDITWIVEWRGESVKDQESVFPRIKVATSKDENSNKLVLKTIEITFPGKEAQVYTKKDLERDAKLENKAVFITLSTFAYAGEIREHLGPEHILPELLRVGMNQTMSEENPFYQLMDKHFNGSEFIDKVGTKGAIVGSNFFQKGVLERGAYDDAAVLKMLADTVLERANWKKHQVKPPINDDHYKAQALNAFYPIIRKWQDQEVRRILKEAKDVPDTLKELKAWSNWCHLNIDTFPNFLDKTENLEEEDVVRLVDFFTWLHGLLTIEHDIPHNGQTILTDIKTASLSFRRFAEGNTGDLAPGGNTGVINAADQLTIARTLLNMEVPNISNAGPKDLDPREKAFFEKELVKLPQTVFPRNGKDAIDLRKIGTSVRI